MGETVHLITRDVKGLDDSNDYSRNTSGYSQTNSAIQANRHIS